MSSSAQIFLSASQAISILLGIGAQVALVVVIATVVRRHRPDAHGSLLAWAIAALVFSVLAPALGFLSITIAARDEIESVILAQAVNTGVGAAIHVALAVLLIRGLVKLAQPPRPLDPSKVGPYR